MVSPALFYLMNGQDDKKKEIGGKAQREEGIPTALAFQEVPGASQSAKVVMDES